MVSGENGQPDSNELLVLIHKQFCLLHHVCKAIINPSFDLASLFQRRPSVRRCHSVHVRDDLQQSCVNCLSSSTKNSEVSFYVNSDAVETPMIGLRRLLLFPRTSRDFSFSRSDVASFNHQPSILHFIRPTS